MRPRTDATARAGAQNAVVDAEPEKGQLARASTRPLQADKTEWTERTLGSDDADPDRSRVLAAMAVQAWFRATRSLSEAVSARLPATLEASSSVVSR